MGRPTMTREPGRGPVPPGSSAPRPGQPPTAVRPPKPGKPPQPATGAGVPSAAPGRVAGRSRFAARARAVRRASWRWKVLPPLVVLLVVGAWWLVFAGPVLVLKDVAVPALPPATADEVRSAARLPEGRPLARLDLTAAQHRVAAIPAVASAEVSRSWPSSVTITVRLRVPVAVVKDGQGGLHLADRTGTAYAEVPSAPDGLPVVQANATDQSAVQAAVQVLAALPVSLRAQVDSVRADGADAVVLSVRHVTVAWGSAQDSVLKMTVLQAILRAEPTAKRIDLTAPRSPSVG